MIRANVVALIATAFLLTGCDDPITAVRSMMTQAAKFLSYRDRHDTAASSPKNCPDVQGHFSLMANDLPGGQFDLQSTFLGGGARDTHDNPWRSVSIDGNAAKELKLTFVRPGRHDTRKADSSSVPAYIRYALETQHDLPVEQRSVVVRPGEHYDCKSGWLVPTRGQPGARIRRDASGDLEGQLVERTARVISLWAETGAGIPYWFDSTTRSARWVAVGAPSVAVSPSSDLPPRPSGGVARQEWDLTYGGGPGPAKPVPVTPRSDQSYDARKAIRALADRDAVVEKISYEGGRYVVTLRVQSRGQVLRTLDNLRGDAWMQDVQDHGVVSGGSRPDVATISMRVVAPR